MAIHTGFHIHAHSTHDIGADIAQVFTAGTVGVHLPIYQDHIFATLSFKSDELHFFVGVSHMTCDGLAFGGAKVIAYDRAVIHAIMAYEVHVFQGGGGAVHLCRFAVGHGSLSGGYHLLLQIIGVPQHRVVLGIDFWARVGMGGRNHHMVDRKAHRICNSFSGKGQFAAIGHTNVHVEQQYGAAFTVGKGDTGGI